MRHLSLPVQIAVIVLVLGGLLACAVGVGWWLARVGRRSVPEPTVSPSPSVRPTAALLPPSTATPTASTAPVVVPPTSTLAPTPTVADVVVVQPGDRGLYDVCRRYCPALDADFRALDAYARRVAEHNNLPWGDGGPKLVQGQRISMLPCPP